MEHIAIITLDRRTFNSFIRIDLNDNPGDKRYVLVDRPDMLSGREFSKAYVLIRQWRHNPWRLREITDVLHYRMRTKFGGSKPIEEIF
jgi:hypothetical protein